MMSADGGAGGDVDGGEVDGGNPGPDAGEDAGPWDAGDDASVPDAGPADGGRDAGAVDGGLPPTTTPSPPPTVVRTGTAGLLLRGTVLTPTGPLDGEVLVVGNQITCVAADCSSASGASAATVIATNGVISPGLIDAHNHTAYNWLGEWVPPMLYTDRYMWAADRSYEDHIRPYAAMRSAGDVYCPSNKWGELRSIIHGTTTVQGQSFEQSCANVLARNADHYHGLGHDHMATNIASPRDIDDATATSLVRSFTAASNPTTRYAVHMAEGVSGAALLSEFDSFAGRDTRPNRHMGISLLAGPGYSGVGLLIHAIPLTLPQLMEVADTDAKVVWSPSSNIVLYGATANIAEWLSLGLTIGIGPDWTPSGEDDLLGELRFALDYGRTAAIAGITPRRVWEMATSDGAEVVGLGRSIGRLEVGYRADIAVFGRVGPDPYLAVAESRSPDVRLVLIDGRGYYGDAALEMATSVNGMCDAFDACGVAKYLCVREVPRTTPSGTTPSRNDVSLDDLRGQLLAILAGYGRSDLLELANDCAP
jgi:cytosine/adenosine deaminase-related metal-dependent hydrolase